MTTNSGSLLSNPLRMVCIDRERPRSEEGFSVDLAIVKPAAVVIHFGWKLPSLYSNLKL